MSEHHEIPKVTSYMPSSSGTRAHAFTVRGLSVLVQPVCEPELNEAAFDLACVFARRDVEDAVIDRQRAQLQADLDAALAKVPPAKPRRLLGEGCVRMRDGAVWLLNSAAEGWSAFGFRFESWDQLFREFDVQVGDARVDAFGSYWPVRNREAVANG